jgi:hypothetical protein
MTKPVQLRVAMLFALVMGIVGALVTSRASRLASVQPSVYPAARMSSPDEKKSCREVIQQALTLGWDDSHNDLAKALVIGRARLPVEKRAYESSCEATVEGGQ